MSVEKSIESKYIRLTNGGMFCSLDQTAPRCRISLPNSCIVFRLYPVLVSFPVQTYVLLQNIPVYRVSQCIQSDPQQIVEILYPNNKDTFGGILKVVVTLLLKESLYYIEI